MSVKAALTKTLFFSRTADFLDVFLIKQCNKSEKTRESYRDALTVFKRYVEYKGKTILTFYYTDCTYEFLLDYKEYLALRKGYSPSSINQRIAAIKSYMKYSYGYDATLMQIYISISGVPFSTVPKIQRKVLAEEAVACLLDKPPATKKGLRDTLIMSLLFDTAIRLDELVRLKTGDIYSKDGYTYLLIHGKGNKERKVSLDESTVRLMDVYLKEYHQNNKLTDNPLIYTIIKGEVNHMSHRNIQKLLKKYAVSAGKDCTDLAESVYPHQLRRSRASSLYQNGTPIEIVSRFLGHSSIETTKAHYAFPSLEQMRNAMNSGNENMPQTESALWIGHEDELARICGLR
jgi:site-specific recombinase XerD